MFPTVYDEDATVPCKTISDRSDAVTVYVIGCARRVLLIVNWSPLS